MHAAAVRFELHIPESRSLKAKRAALRPVVDGLRHKYRISVAEVDHHDQWQRAALGVAAVAADAHQLASILENVRRFVDTRPDVELLEIETHALDETSLQTLDWELA